MRTDPRWLAVTCALLVVGCQTIGRSTERYEVCEDPAAAQAYQGARALIDAGELAPALPLLRRAVEACPDFVLAHEFYQDSAAKLGGEADAAMRRFYAQLEDASDSPLLPYLESRLSDNNRDRLALLTEALRRDDSFYRAYQARADIYRRLRRTDRALDELRKAILANPDCPEANLAIAEVLARLGRFREAVRHYHAHQQLSPGSQSVRKDYLALLIYQLGELDEAERILQDLLAFDALDVEVLMDKAAIAWLRDDFAAALQTYQEILQIDGNQAEAVLNIGNLYFQAMAGSSEAGKRQFWPRARLAYTYYLEHCQASSGFDQLDQWLGVPVRLRQIDALLGVAESLSPGLGDFD